GLAKRVVVVEQVARQNCPFVLLGEYIIQQVHRAVPGSENRIKYLRQESKLRFRGLILPCRGDGRRGVVVEQVARQNSSFVLSGDLLFSKCPVQCPALRTESIIQGEPLMARDIWRPIKEFSASNSLLICFLLLVLSKGIRMEVVKRQESKLRFRGLILPCRRDERRGGSWNKLLFRSAGGSIIQQMHRTVNGSKNRMNYLR
ncbi:hypothetical protein CDAR_413511, partial [Caerostris darwini]